MGAVVWYADWQMECCGEPFELGDRVTWTVEEADDREWLPAALGPDHAVTVTHLEEHHAQDESRLLTLTGFVTKITGPGAPTGRDTSVTTPVTRHRAPSGSSTSTDPTTSRASQRPASPSTAGSSSSTRTTEPPTETIDIRRAHLYCFPVVDSKEVP